MNLILLAGWLAATTVKAAALLLGAAIVARVATRAAAATRHLVWRLAFAAVLIVPLASGLVPRFTPALRLPIAVPPINAAAGGTPFADDPSVGAVDLVVPQLATRSGSGESEILLWVVTVWVVGAIAVGAWILLGMVGAARFARRAIGLETDHVAKCLGAATRAIGLTAPVSLGESREITTPLVCGVLHRWVLLPAGAAEWTGDRLYVTLLHELAHVARRDTIMQFLSNVACALYWFLPLVWYARRRERAEREAACDDRVLLAGASRVVYADQLVRVAGEHRLAIGLGATALAMSAPGELETRIGRILDPLRPRRGRAASRAVAVTTAIAAVGLLGAMQAVDSTDRFSRLYPLISDIQRGPDNPTGELLHIVIPPSTIDAARAMLTTSPDSAAIRRLLVGTDMASSEPWDLIAERSAWALTLLADGVLVPHLIDALHDRDWRVRAYAAWSLGVSGDARCIPVLVDALRDLAWRVRSEAVWALVHNGEASAAVSVVGDLLHDPAWQVRLGALELLENIGDTRWSGAAAALTRDPHPGVRQRAASLALQPGDHSP